MVDRMDLEEELLSDSAVIKALSCVLTHICERNDQVEAVVCIYFFLMPFYDFIAFEN